MANTTGTTPSPAISSRRTPRASASASRAGCSTATARRCRIACWRSGRPTRRAASPIRRTSARCRIRSFKGFGRCGTDANGGYAFDTIKPGAVPDPDGKPQAPHLLLAIFARGMLLHLYTRIYFGGEAANAADPVLALVPADRRATLIAEREMATATRSIGSTSACRATTRRCFSTCERCAPRQGRARNDASSVSRMSRSPRRP